MATIDFEFTFFFIALFLILIKIVHVFTRKADLPDVLGEIVLGFILGPSLLGFLFLKKNPISSLSNIFDINMEHLELTATIIEFISEFAVLLLLFKIGTEIDFALLNKVKKPAFFSTIGGIFLPFLAGIGFVLIAVNFFATNIVAADIGVNNVAVLVGVALTATSIGISLRIFLDAGKIKSKVAQTVIGAAVFDDIIAVTLIGLSLAYFDNTAVLDSNRIFIILFKIVIFFVISFILFKTVIPKLLRAIKSFDDKSVPIFVSIAFMLLMAVLAQFLELTPIIGAFVAGVIIGNEEDYLDIHKDFEPISDWIIPFFFVTIGLRINVVTLFGIDILLLTGLLTTLSIIAKFIGGSLGSKIANNDWNESKIIGLSMAARGEITIIFTTTAFSLGYFNEVLYGIIILTVVLTTLIIVPLIKMGISNWMD